MDRFAPIFLSHGSPMTALGGGAAAAFWRELGQVLEARAAPPTAIVVVSAHTLARRVTTLAAPRPPRGPAGAARSGLRPAAAGRCGRGGRGAPAARARGGGAAGGRGGGGGRAGGGRAGSRLWGAPSRLPVGDALVFVPLCC